MLRTGRTRQTALSARKLRGARPDMGFVIGMDEAGYGPNLGPLVLTATVWEVPGRWPKRTDFWQIFADIAERKATAQQPDAHDGDQTASRPKRSPGRPRAKKNNSRAEHC